MDRKRPGRELERALSLAGTTNTDAGGSCLEKRKAMVAEQVISRGISNPRVIKAMERVPREIFVPQHIRQLAYEDCPLPLGSDQTISQPYIVAYMSEQLRIGPESKVLEIGSGSGYQTAILAEIAASVHSVEIIPHLAEKAKMNLEKLGYDNVSMKLGDGNEGWPGKAPFDRIIITAAPPVVPKKLVAQLSHDGVMITPVGKFYQELILIEKFDGKAKRKSLIPVRFVPMVGKEDPERDGQVS